MKHILALLRTAPFCSPLSSNLAPNAQLSAAPHLLDTLRLPCSATGIPAAEINKTRCSRMLNVLVCRRQYLRFPQQYLHEAYTEPASRA